MWVFSAIGSRFPAGVFSTVDLAVEWIRKNGLTGVLTEYPLDEGVYDWVVGRGTYKPRGKEDAAFIAGFSSAYQQHFHFENGVGGPGQTT